MLPEVVAASVVSVHIPSTGLWWWQTGYQSDADLVGTLHALAFFRDTVHPHPAHSQQSTHTHGMQLLLLRAILYECLMSRLSLCVCTSFL